MPLTLVASITLVTAVGASVVAANPRRVTNQAFGLVCLSSTVWLTLVLLHGRIADPLTTTRLNAIVASIFPWNLWLLKAAIIYPNSTKRSVLRASLPWLSVCLMLAPLCFAASFIETDAHSERTRRGIAHDIHSILLGILYLVVVLQSARETRRQTGIRRLEIQFVVFNIGLGALTCFALIVIGNYLV
jgi:hypothetical protein